ncbi:hypothetical protein HYC85_031190 [Camellia sinensis]|uniref:rRNA-processing protein FYV7 n=1 Tax=Camellia sinensis TaxID=4442 RepID=A0A7J7FQP6_CAMSI|nr:hypothetical protein HYC85_031190 [Camellia sinensis]
MKLQFSKDNPNGRREKIDGSSSINQKKIKKKNVMRLGGGGLSLETFANAKTKSNQYNPALIKKQREFYKNAKYDENETEIAGEMNKKNKNYKKSSQSLQELYKKKREEEEMAKIERDAIIQAKKEERERAESRRKALRGKMLKKTRLCLVQGFEEGFENKKDISPKQREFYKNAKYVSKYKKSLKQQSQQNDRYPAMRPLEDENETEIAGEMNKKNKNYKKGSQSLQELYKKKREEEEKAKIERDAIIQAKKEERERAESRRKALRGKMLKKTRSGQPIMKYRIEHLLETIRQGSTN